MELPPPLDALPRNDRDEIIRRLRPVHFLAGDRIFRAGDVPDGCYIIASGQVRLEIERDRHIDTEAVLGFIEGGSILGELALLDGLPRSLSAYAETLVEASHLSIAAIEELSAQTPRIGLGLFRALGRDAAIKLRRTTDRLVDYAAMDMPDADIDAIVERAITAQRAIECWPEERVDEVLLAMATAINAEAERLAAQTVRETRMGNVPDKTQKNAHASLGVYRSLAGKRGLGILDTAGEREISEIASPAGVVFAIVPITNPVATIIFKALITIKARCALILSFPRGALRVCNDACAIILRALEQVGAPPDVVQWVGTRPNRSTTLSLMRHPGVSLILATGGSAMVRAAYSSGKPALGAGPGNAPVYVALDADIEAAAQRIVVSKSYDNGLICGAEHNLIAHASVLPRLSAALEHRGAAVLTANETATIMNGRFVAKEGRIDSRMVGREASDIAERLGIERPYPIKVIVIPITRDQVTGNSPLAREKLMPVLSLLSADSDDDAIAICLQVLALEGKGHTAIVHTASKALAQRFGLAMPASRILVNSPGTHGVSGITTGLIPSFTLGCGTLGGNSSTDNVSFHNLLNIKRLAYFVDPQMQLRPVVSENAGRGGFER